MTVILTQQVGNDGKLRVCNATCHNARKPKCDCICGGLYHGVSRGGIMPSKQQLKEDQEDLDSERTLAWRYPTKEYHFGPTTKGTGNASDYDLEDLVGRKIRSLMDFSGVPKGTEGIIEKAYDIGQRHSGVMVKWTNNPSGNPLSDGFGRDAKFDETQWLEVLA